MANLRRQINTLQAALKPEATADGGTTVVINQGDTANANLPVPLQTQVNPTAAGLPAQTLTADMAQGYFVHTVLDHDLTVTAPENPPTAGLRITYTFTQDATGYRKVTLPAAFGDATLRFMPRQGPAQSSSLELVSNGDGTYQLLGFDGIDVTKPHRVHDWGAKGDNASDDAPAIQACLDYVISKNNGTFAIGEVPSIDFATGLYLLGHPLHVWGAVKCTGDTKAGTFIGVANNAFSYQGPSVVWNGRYTSDVHPHIDTTHVSTDGNGLDLRLASDALDHFFVPFYSCDVLRQLDGLAAFTFAFRVNPAYSDGGAEFYKNIFSSSGKVRLEDDIGGAWGIQLINAQNSIAVTLCIGGSFVRVAAPSNSLPQNTVSHVEVDYDGSTVYLFVGGVLMGSAAATGTLTQRKTEDVILGKQFELFPYQSPVTSGPDAVIYSLHVSYVARHTSAFTPPTTPDTGDNYTVFLTNFETVSFSDAATDYPPFLKSYLQYGTAGKPVYTLIRSTGPIPFTGVEWKNISVGGSVGLDVQGVQQSVIDGVVCQVSQAGIFLENNCYENTIENIICTSADYAACVNTNSSGVNHWAHLNLSASVPIAGDGFHMEHAYVPGNGEGCLIGVSDFQDAIQVQMENVNVVDEGNTTSKKALVFRSCTATLTNCAVEKLFATDTSPMIDVSGASRLVFDRCCLNAPTAQGNYFNLVADPPEPIVVKNPKHWDSNGADVNLPYVAAGKEKFLKLEDAGSYADTSGTPGSATAHKLQGLSAIPSGSKSITITNRLVGATGIVAAWVQQVDATLTHVESVPVTGGAFTINCDANATADTKVAWEVRRG